MFGQRLQVVGRIASRQQGTVYRRVQRLHPTVQHFREVGDLADVSHVDAGLTQRLRRAPRGNEIPAEAGQALGEINKTAFVGN